MAKGLGWVRLAAAMLLIFSILSLSPAPARAAGAAVSAMDSLYRKIENAIDGDSGWVKKAQVLCLQLLAVTAVIGFAIGLKDLSVSGQLSMDGIAALFARYAFIVGLTVWLLNNPEHLGAIPSYVKELGRRISGQDIDLKSVMNLHGDLTAPLWEAFESADWKNFGLIISLLLLLFFINCLFFMIGATVLVVQIEVIFIFIGGLFTASFFVIGYFRDIFMGYVKGLVSAGVKQLLLCLLLGLMTDIMAVWPALIKDVYTAGGDYTGLIPFLVSVSCALVIFYMILQAVPQYAAAIMTGSPAGGGGSAVTGAAGAAVGTAMTVINTAKWAGGKAVGGAQKTSNVIEAFSSTSQAMRDTGSTSGRAKMAGFAEAAKSVMGSPSRDPRAAGERIYSNHQRAQQFADVRNGGANSVSAPSSGSSGKEAKTDAGGKTASSAKS